MPWQLTGIWKPSAPLQSTPGAPLRSSPWRPWARRLSALLRFVQKACSQTNQNDREKQQIRFHRQKLVLRCCCGSKIPDYPESGKQVLEHSFVSEVVGETVAQVWKKVMGPTFAMQTIAPSHWVIEPKSFKMLIKYVPMTAAQGGDSNSNKYQALQVQFLSLCSWYL